MFTRTISFCAEHAPSIYCLRHGLVWCEVATTTLRFILVALLPALAFAQQGNISVDSIRVLNTTPDFLDIELSGSNDGSMGQLCLGVIAKSVDGSVQSSGYPPVILPGTKQFQIKTQAMRPSSLLRQKTDLLMVMVYTCGKDGGLTRKFDWPYIWPEKKPTASDGENDNIERPWLAFYGNLIDMDFEALDILIQNWNDPKERDRNGEWKLDSFRQVFVNYSSMKRDWKGDQQRIKKWRAFNPKSTGAAIAEAKYWAAYAWHIRGSETSIEVDPVALRVFGERMQRAEQVLKDSKDFAADNPLWYEAYLDIATAAGRDSKFVEALFNEAIRRHPYFQPLYLGMAKYWVPRSGKVADWNKVDEIINLATTNTARIDGTINYAILYVQISGLQQFEFDLFRDSLVSWAKMRDSFLDLVKRYPSADNLNEFAAFACRADDKSTFLNVRPQIINRILPGKWPGNYSYDLCDRRFMQST